MDPRRTEYGQFSRYPDLQRSGLHDVRAELRRWRSTPNCNPNGCRLWVAAAGGGIWRTDNALSGQRGELDVSFKQLRDQRYRHPDLRRRHNTLYAGTGEPNASADSEAGFGIYKSTDGGDTWTHLAANTSVRAEDVDCGRRHDNIRPRLLIVDLLSMAVASRPSW